MFVKNYCFYRISILTCKQINFNQYFDVVNTLQESNLIRGSSTLAIPNPTYDSTTFMGHMIGESET